MSNVQQNDPDVFTIDSVYSVEECNALIARAESIGFEAASVRTRSGQKMMKELRNNDRVALHDVKLAEDMWNRVKNRLPILDGEQPTSVDPNLRFYRYVPGQKFNRHRDGSVTNEKSQTSKLSYLVYLNTSDGGETVFRDYVEIEGARSKKELSIQAKTGSALIFRHERWHEGSPVVSGKKYVLRTDIFYSGGEKTER